MFPCLIALVSCIPAFSALEAPPLPAYHLTARPWTPLAIGRDAYLAPVESLCRHIAQYQDGTGAIIDPHQEREFQYATPYFAFAVAVLAEAGRAGDLLSKGVAAMEHATGDVAAGNSAIPDQHGEFYLGSLAEACERYTDHVSADTVARWRERLRQPIAHIIEGVDLKTNNWRAYAMRGEWLRVCAGLADPEPARAFIEDGWHHRTQRARIVLDRWSLYQDWSSAPQSHAVEAVGRVNLLGLVHSGYDGPSADAIRRHAERGSHTSLLLQDPTGQSPPNGRTDNHVFNDVLYMLTHEIMAERMMAQGALRLAGQYRRAALLGFQSIDRWQRREPELAGTYSITKNHFPIADRVGYQPASNWTNYSGAGMVHLAEAWLIRQSDIEEAPAPCEIGGFALSMDPAFASITANAGGMQVFANLQGDVVPKYGIFWTPLGIVRFSRSGWDSRLGPSDGIYSREARSGVTFAPTWQVGQRWTRLSENAVNYRGTLDIEFVHPLLVRLTIVYHQETGVGGPSFYHELTITPDGVLSRLRATGTDTYGLTLPLLADDGEKLAIALSDTIASVAYPDAIGTGDEQHFIALNDGGRIEEDGEAILSSYGYLKPLRQTAPDESLYTFVYPRNNDAPTARAVLDSFTLTPDGFHSVLGRVEGTLYVGRTAAGGYGSSLDLDQDGNPDVALDADAGFITQHTKGRITAIETDRAVTADVQGQTLRLQAHEPWYLE